MATIAVIHVREKRRDALTTGVLKKGVARSHRAASGASADGLLSSSLPISSAPANGILPTRALTTLPIQVPTEQVPSTQARITRPIHALTKHALPTHATLPIHTLATLAPHIRITLPAGAWTYHEDSECPGVFTGIAALDHEISSIPKAALTQVCASQSMSSGKAAILCSLLAQVTDAEEVCALIDAGGCFSPSSAAMAGVDLSRLLWVRCGKKIKAGFAEKSTVGLRPMVGHQAITTRSRPTTGPGPATTGHQSMTDSRATNGRPSITSSGAITGRQSIADRRATTVRQATTNSQAGPQTESAKNASGGTLRREADNRIAPANNRIAASGFRGADARRMQPIEQTFKAADILIQNGGFGLIAIDLGEIEERLIRKIPLTTWFRFARVIERQPTALVVFATYPAAQSCAALTLHIKSAAARWHTGAHAHAQLLSGLTCEVEPGRVRGRVRKPMQSAHADFAATPVWK